MNADLHDLLATRADAVTPPRIDPLAAVARGRHLVRRRRTLAGTGAAVAAVCVVVAALALGPGDRADTMQPANPDRTTGVLERELIYGEGQILHVGDDTIDTGFDFLSLDVTDEGAALTSLDGGIWFSDGTEVVQVGQVPGGDPSGPGVGWKAGRPGEWVVSDSSGSLLAWVESGGPRGLPELVVYDSAARLVTARRPIDGRRRDVGVSAIVGRDVFVWVSRSMLRYDLDSVAVDRVDEADLESARRSISRSLLVGTSAETGAVVHSAGDYLLSDFDGWFDVRDLRLDGVFDPRTGQPLDIEVPPGYETTRLAFIQWLGDDQFVLASGSYPQGDLLRCQIAAGRCAVLIEESAWDRTPLLPGFGGFGSEFAKIDAIRQDVG